MEDTTAAPGTGPKNTPVYDGGPAFPVPDSVHPSGQVQFGTNGMTLRDYFAGQALTGTLAMANPYEAVPHGIAEHCYKYADAMLSARKGAPDARD
jgi:hypothetical protein